VTPTPLDLVVLGYRDRLSEDHDTILSVARECGLTARLVTPSQVTLHVDHTGEHVRVDGQRLTPRAVVPRGINRPWPMMKQILECWYTDGAHVVPSITAADVCADKITTARALSRAGVPILSTIGVVPGGDMSRDAIDMATDAGILAKPARGSKARGVNRFVDAAAAHYELARLYPLEDGAVDHQVVQPVASAAGIDYRIVVAGTLHPRVIAATRRIAPPYEFITNRPHASVEDCDDRLDEINDVVDVAIKAAQALGLAFCGIDVIMHHGQAVVLEANAWPGLAVQHRGDALARALVDEVISALQNETSPHVTEQFSRS
jgi:glutathione synthase/RimK-type ligase-like ATP-grasp enzyme